MILQDKKGLLLYRTDRLGERDWRYDSCYKLIFTPYGKSLYQTSRSDIQIEEDQFFIFNPKFEHKQIQVTKEKFLVEIEPNLLNEIAGQLGVPGTDIEFASTAFKNPLLLQWVSFTKNFLTMNENMTTGMQKLFIESSLIQLTTLMLQYAPGSQLEELPHSLYSPNINRVLDALKQSYQQDWSLDDMATMAGMNKFPFSHAFKRETGLSAYSWLQLFRLLKSQHFLTKTNRSILSIALDVGFKNVSSYNTLFIKIYGRTPSEFRLLYRRNS
ncbi:AraC family transcriptional regulator [Virgibacillus sp. SK37]|uniref:helix-turn-helix domain-containing protein n=1 Tax=Virgibacillus sp. SK37 TaxID=403957 RepID=UPI0004D1A576|nr:AraC family transcriptional regulator [Virgibacillus sp. SK37]AIF42585.1 AraC family transcriptional regulator [Virgibacillus sp. SK37]